MNALTIFTIGHSTRSIDDFIKLLHSFNIKFLADIRTYPGSRRFPHFNKENLKEYLAENNICYQHIPALGGRRKAVKDSKNNAWKNESFRGYADHMETEEFKNSINELEETAFDQVTAYMCSEGVWWRCHRSLVSDYLKWKGWKVLHIFSEQKAEQHPYTSPAHIENGKLSYIARDVLF